MTASRFGAVLLAIVSALVLGVTSMLTSAFVLGVERFIANIALLADEGWIMSGTGQPDPTVGPYIGQVEGLYLQPPSPLFPGQPTFDTYNFQGLTTPEQFCPFVCLPPPNPQLNFGDSLAAGVTDLNNAITPQLAAGDNVAVFGYSQSATIATIEMQNLLSNPPAGVDLSNLNVVLIGDPNNPIGGILTRFDFPDGIKAFSLTPAPQHVPFVNIPLSIGAGPTDTIPTDIYTGEYDGWASFPQDPLNILADINALIGIETVHGYYPGPTPGVNLDTGHIIDLGTIGETNFYAIPAPLPILAFMYDGGPAGQFFYDAFAPFTRLFIDWGYGNPGDPGADGQDLLYPVAGSWYNENVGWAGGPWAVTPFGELSDASGVAGFFEKMDPLQVLAGIQFAGIQSFVGPIADLLDDAGVDSSTISALSTGLTDFGQLITGYDLVNLADTTLLDGLKDLGGLFGPQGTAAVEDLVNFLFDGPLIPGQPFIDLVGVGFDVFNFFGA